MNANMVLLDHIFNKSRELVIPFYQRAYVWDKEQWARLLEDMKFITSTQKPYFIGSIILKKGNTTVAESVSDRRVIVDGQQRLTTLVIFFKAYYLLANQNDDFIFDFGIKAKDNALKPGILDIDAFKLVSAHADASEIEDISNSKIIQAFNYFLNNININEINGNAIKQQLQFVCIEIDESEDEQKIFDTINSLGVRLTTAELLKNYFFGQEDIEKYKATWFKTFESDDQREYWDEIISNGSQYRPLIDVFFEAYFKLFINNKKYSVSAENKNLYERNDALFSSYKSFIAEYCNGDKNIILDGLFDCAKLFKGLFNPDLLNQPAPSSPGLGRLNVVIFGLDNTTVIPYILYFAKNNPNDEAIDEMCRLFEAYFLKRIITKESTKNYNNLFTSFILNEIDTTDKLKQALIKINGLTTDLPYNSEVLDGFHSSKLTNRQTKGIIYLIESSLFKKNASVQLYGFNKYSLEHLLPKKWRNKWESLPDEEAKIRDNTLLTLGNLAIITQKLNTSIMDGDWATKKAGKKDSFGLSAYAVGLITMEDVLKQNTWNEDRIYNRANWLYTQANKIWDLHPLDDSECEVNDIVIIDTSSEETQNSID